MITSEEILMLQELETLTAQLGVEGLKSVEEFKALLLSETIPVSCYYPTFRNGMGNMFNFLLWVGRSATTENRFVVEDGLLTLVIVTMTHSYKFTYCSEFTRWVIYCWCNSEPSKFPSEEACDKGDLYEYFIRLFIRSSPTPP